MSTTTPKLTIDDMTAPSPMAATSDALAAALEVFHRWLYLPDDDQVVAALGAVAANLVPGDPLWLLFVGPPGSGKTETINPLAHLPYVHPVATFTEASLLSGSPKREVAKDAKGGLLRTMGDFGIIMAKDFSGVLSMNRDARAQLLSALREVYDGSWTRRVGTDGGRELTWRGKAGLVGAVTPSIDRHHAVMGALGERFVLYRISVDDPKAQARRALANRGHGQAMRAELAEAVETVIALVDTEAPPRALTDSEIDLLIDLAAFVVQARSAVERDGYDREVVVMPSAEAPGRLVHALSALLAGCEAVGADDATCWRIVTKAAWDSVPDIRRRMLWHLHDHPDQRLADVVATTGVPRTTAERCLDDLVLLHLVDRRKDGDANNAVWRFTLNDQARSEWPTR